MWGEDRDHRDDLSEGAVHGIGKCGSSADVECTEPYAADAGPVGTGEWFKDRQQDPVGVKDWSFIPENVPSIRKTHIDSKNWYDEFIKEIQQQANQETEE